MSTVLGDSCLILNKHWIPVHITSVRDAIGLIYVGTAKLIVPNQMKDRADRIVCHEYEVFDYEKWIEISARLDPEDYILIHSAKEVHFKPSVITLVNYDSVPKYEIRFSRSSIYERDSGICQYCGRHMSKSEATIDHITPRSKGGTNTWKNTVLSCKKCNEKKGSRSLEESGLKLLSEPKKPSWISTKYGKARSIQEKEDWLKFVEYV